MKANAIVIIDDDDDDRFLLAEAFRIIGTKQKIVEVSCGNDFITLCDKWYTAPNLILIDVEMPGMNGLDLMGVLRQYVQLIETPKVMLSTSAAYREKAQNVGADDFYVKPAILNEYLDLARAIQLDYLA